MKFNHKIEIDLFDFLKSGYFDYIKLGQSKEWIANNFPDPDETNLKNTIWRYGNLEFYFDKNGILFMIFTDFIRDLDGGKSLKLNKWIFETPIDLTLQKVAGELNLKRIDYSKKTEIDNSITILLNKGSTLNKS